MGKERESTVPEDWMKINKVIIVYVTTAGFYVFVKAQVVGFYNRNNTVATAYTSSISHYSRQPEL